MATETSISNIQEHHFGQSLAVQVLDEVMVLARSFKIWMPPADLFFRVSTFLKFCLAKYNPKTFSLYSLPVFFPAGSSKIESYTHTQEMQPSFQVNQEAWGCSYKTRTEMELNAVYTQREGIQRAHVRMRKIIETSTPAPWSRFLSPMTSPKKHLESDRSLMEHLFL